jgi:pyruvate dehydrogenase E2 component (dihydrolipoamide acetyltransferase)
MADFVMPSLGADMDAGTLVGWHKQPGDRVERGEIVADVETQKGVIAVEVFTSGVIEKLLVPSGEKVPVGTVLATIHEDAASPSVPAPASLHDRSIVPTRAPSATAIAAATAAGAPTPAPSLRPAISPSARRLARELGIDPSTVRPTGHGGAITREDILGAAQRPASQEPASVAKIEARTSAEAARRIRQAIAAAMARSKREIPHYYLSTTIDLHRALAWLAEANLQRPVSERLLYGALLLKATSLALREIPELNAVWERDEVVLRQAIHVGVAISLRQGGLVAPAIHHTDRLSIDDLMCKLRDLTERARSGGLRSSELSDSTITVTSLGERGVEAVFGIIFPPQVAIVGFGRVVERPWSIDGGIYSRPTITVTLAADHRVSDGHRGGLFLNAIDRLLQSPEKL